MNTNNAALYNKDNADGKWYYRDAEADLLHDESKMPVDPYLLEKPLSPFFSMLEGLYELKALDFRRNLVDIASLPDCDRKFRDEHFTAIKKLQLLNRNPSRLFTEAEHVANAFKVQDNILSKHYLEEKGTTALRERLTGDSVVTPVKTSVVNSSSPVSNIDELKVIPKCHLCCSPLSSSCGDRGFDGGILETENKIGVEVIKHIECNCFSSRKLLGPLFCYLFPKKKENSQQ